MANLLADTKTVRAQLTEKIGMACLSHLMPFFSGARKATHSGMNLAGEQGSELIEIAIVLPLYFMLIFGLMSFALVLFAYCNATFAAKAAVRYAVVHSNATMSPCSPTVIQNIVNPFLWGAPTGGVAINPVWTSTNTVGNIVSVTVTLTYSTGMPYAGLQGLVATATSQGYIVH